MQRSSSLPASTGWRVRASLLSILLALGALAGGHDSQSQAAVPDVALTPLGTFSAPLSVTSPPGDPTRLFVVERGGTVRIVQNGVVLPTPFIDVSSEIGLGGERGLLSIAFAPDFAISGLVYADATLPNGTIVIWEFHAAAGAGTADAGHRLVLSIPHPATNHNGGQLQFGPDGYLYIGVGDGGTGANGQNTGVLLGKILRIDPRASGGQAYTIPPGQPFAAGAAPEVYAYGFRNPWRFSFDGLTGDLLIGEVGENDWEEIDQLPAGQAPGANLGWNCWEGTHPFAGGQCSVPSIPPILEYAHDASHCSISGGFVARDATVPTIAGRYLYGDYCGTAINAVLLPVTAPADIVQLGAAPSIAGFGQDSDGHLYVTSLKGEVWRVTGTGAADKPPVASFTLSSSTPAVGANVHLDASGSTDPDGPIFSYSWDTDGDGKIDGHGVAFDVSYPTAGARAITLTVTDAVGAHSSRTLPVYVGGKTTPPGTTSAVGRLRATLSAPSPQKLAIVRRRGLLVRFRGNAPATWTLTATLRRTRGLHEARMRPASGRLYRKTFKAHTGSGTMRLRIPAATLTGRREVVIRVEARVRFGGQTVRRSIGVRVGA
ncbi:MAG: PQQ-dependent sugar dehydrogenase [Actinomycetota bacterium]|nr:PQQ-dependent sugar dehydrogenase [Actinomycetota bacterium]